jgi:hypothetical protein
MLQGFCKSSHCSCSGSRKPSLIANGPRFSQCRVAVRAAATGGGYHRGQRCAREEGDLELQKVGGLNIVVHAGMSAGNQLLTNRSAHHSVCTAGIGTTHSTVAASGSPSRHAWLAQDKRLCDAVLVLVPAKGMTCGSGWPW